MHDVFWYLVVAIVLGHVIFAGLHLVATRLYWRYLYKPPFAQIAAPSSSWLSSDWLWYVVLALWCVMLYRVATRREWE